MKKILSVLLTIAVRSSGRAKPRLIRAVETWLTALNTAFERVGLEAGPLSP
jgi:hypothetical protein